MFILVVLNTFSLFQVRAIRWMIVKHLPAELLQEMSNKITVSHSSWPTVFHHLCSVLPKEAVVLLKIYNYLSP